MHNSPCRWLVRAGVCAPTPPPPATQRALQNVVREMDLHPVAKPLYGHPQDCLPNAAEAVEAHLLAVQGPQGRCLPEWIAKVVQSTKCSLLVYKDTEPTIL